MKTKILLFFLGFYFVGLNAFCQPPFLTPDNIGSGNCLDFDGVNDHVHIPHHTSLNRNGGDITVEAWVKTSSASRQAIVIKRDDSNAGIFPFWGFEIGSTGRISGSLLKDNSNKCSGSGNMVITDDLWHSVAMSYSSSSNSMNLYVDGVLDATIFTSGTVDTYDNTDILTFGRTATSGNIPFNGQIDEIRIWSTARTQQEIQDNMSIKLSGNETGLIGYWNMNEGADNTCSGGEDVCDISINNNNGTLQ